MKKGTKVRLTFAAGALIGAIFMFVGLAGNDAEAPRPPRPVRFVEPVFLIRNNPTPCPVELTHAACKSAREADR